MYGIMTKSFAPTNKLRRQRGTRPAKRCARPGLESLEARLVLSSNPTVLQTNLVSDLPGVAQVMDPNLVNPWGISESGGSPFWISDNNAGVSTLYNTAGMPQTLVVSIPTPPNPLGASGAPTETVFNIDGGPTGGFKVSGFSNTGTQTSGAAVFLFATEDGTIVGWNPGDNPTGFDPAKAGTYAIIAVDNSGNNFTEPDPAKQTGAVYKGLTIANSATPGTPIFASDPNTTTVLYAANFRSGKVEVYDTKFQSVALPAGAFADPNLPSGYAPFNVQVLGSQVYVTYAQQNADKHDDVAGQGHGFIDVFNLDGTPGLSGGTERLVSGGPLNSPWGLALAPPSFGALKGDLLVGNFGSGFIDVFNPTNGTFLGNLKDPDGEPIQIDGLWALKVGNGGSGGATNTVYFTAGLDHETHGLFGSLTPVAANTPEGPAEQQTVTAFQDVLQLAVQTFNTDLSSGASKTQLRQDLQAVDTALRDFVRAEVNFVLDSQADQGGHQSSHHDLDDIFSILGSHDRI